MLYYSIDLHQRTKIARVLHIYCLYCFTAYPYIIFIPVVQTQGLTISAASLMQASLAALAEQRDLAVFQLAVGVALKK